MNETLNADPAELAKFSEQAHRWWDPDSEFRPLHDINPLRLDHIDAIAGLAGKDVYPIVVSCQEERSQLKNRMKAMTLLKSRLYAMEQEKRDQAIADLSKEVKVNVIKQGNSYNVFIGNGQALVVSSQAPITAMIGPSGCGKSTILRSLNRMNDLIDGARVEGTMKVRLPSASAYAAQAEKESG